MNRFRVPGVALAAALAVASIAAWMAPNRPSAVLRRESRIPVQVADARLDGQAALVRQAVHAHLKLLGLPVSPLREGLTAIDGRAQQGLPVDATALEELSLLALDSEGAAKAYEILVAYAEMKTFGEPVSYDLAVNDLDRIRATRPVRSAEDTVSDDVGDGLAIDASPAPAKIGGTCLPCGSVDFGPFTPTPLVQTHSWATTAGGNDCAWYSFNVTAGARYWFSTCNSETGGTTGWDTILEVYEPTNCSAFVAANDQGTSLAGCSPRSRVFYDATTTGTLLVRLRGFSTQGGPYTLGFWTEGIVCETCVNPNPVPIPPPTGVCQCRPADTTTTTCPSDYWQIPLVAGETYEFTTCPANCAGAAGGYDTLLRIWEPVGCTSAGSNDDNCSSSGLSTRSTLTYTATVTGIHRLQVTGRLFTSGAVPSGTYTLCYRRTSAACPTCASGPYQTGLNTIPTTTCANHSGSITACQANWYDFQLTAGATYEFATCVTGGCPGGASALDTVLELHSAAGCGGLPVAVADDECGSGSQQSFLTFTPGVGGNYRLRVRTADGATGPYTLSYREVPGGCTAPTALSIAPTSGSVAPGTCTKTQTFSVSVDNAATTPISYSWSISPAAFATPAVGGPVVSSGSGGAPASFDVTFSREGTYAVTVTASNACGSFQRTVNYVLTDSQAPQVTAAPDTAASCSAVPPAAPPVVADNCDPSPAVTFAEVRVNGACPDTYELRRTWTATDRSGNASSDMQIVQVSDTTPPVLVGMPADVEADCEDVPPPADVTASDNCDPSPSITFTESAAAGSCPGNYVLTRTWTARDRCGNETTATQVVTVTDTTPPVIVPSTTQVACIWPPNHKYACFGPSSFAPAISDNCSAPVTWSFAGVTGVGGSGNCGDGGPNHDDEVMIDPSGQGFCIRAQRCGQERGFGGRTFTVTAVATDACGNVSSPTPIGTIFVPHDQRSHPDCVRPQQVTPGF